MFLTPLDEDQHHEKSKHIISLLVQNKFGALTRIAALFSGRGYNIESLTVGLSKDPDLARMTIVTHGDADVIEQIEKQLKKLIDVIDVTPLNGKEYIARELMLIKVNATEAERSEIMQIADIFNARIASLHQQTITVQITGDHAKLDAFVDLMRKFGIIEISRSGIVGMSRADEDTHTV